MSKHNEPQMVYVVTGRRNDYGAEVHTMHVCASLEAVEHCKNTLYTEGYKEWDIETEECFIEY